MEPQMDNHTVRPLRASVDPDADRVAIQPHTAICGSDYSESYMQTTLTESEYDRGWTDGFKCRGGWGRVLITLAVAMVGLAAAILVASRH